MGNKLSAIDYFEIESIIDNSYKLSHLKRSKYNYEIQYNNGKKFNISLNDAQNYKFHLKYRWAKEFKPLINLNYIDIQSITYCKSVFDDNNNTMIYTIEVLYNDQNTRQFSFSKGQMNLFLRNIHNLTPFGKKIKLDFIKKNKYDI
jgi:hypothetical protein